MEVWMEAILITYVIRSGSLDQGWEKWLKF